MVCNYKLIKKAKDIAHIPIWIIHGAEDAVVDPKEPQKMLYALTEAGGNPGYTQYPGVGHFSWLAAYDDPFLMQWLFSQRRKD